MVAPRRRSRRWPVVVVAVALALVGACRDGGGDAAARRAEAARAEARRDVAATFAAYKDAVAARRGQAALAYVSSSAAPHYDRLRRLALDADEATLRREPRVVDQLAVLTMRLTLDPDLLRSAPARAIVAAAIDAGLAGGVAGSGAGSGAAAGIELGPVVVSGDTAHAPAVIASASTQARVLFVRQAGRWKVDLVGVIAVAESFVRAEAAQQGVELAQVVDQLLVTAVGEERAAAAWQPLGRGSPA